MLILILASLLVNSLATYNYLRNRSIPASSILSLKIMLFDQIMASKISFKTVAAFALAFFFLVQGSLGAIVCEQLGEDKCAFAVSSSGKRCVLEKQVKRNGLEAFTCRTSEIEAEKLKDYIESNQCIKDCGLDRKSLGISSDSLLESRCTRQLCSPQCYQSCPNVIDLYFNLAAGEGVFLPKLCEAQGGNTRREMAEIRSSGIVAPGPIKAETLTEVAAAPAYAPK